MDEETKPLTAEQVIDKRIAMLLRECEGLNRDHPFAAGVEKDLLSWVDMKMQAERDNAAQGNATPASTN